MARDLIVDAKLVIPGEELEWHSVRASGPGGQNVNKVSTKVILRFDVDGSSVLSASLKHRLKKMAANRLDAEGWALTSLVSPDTGVDPTQVKSVELKEPRKGGAPSIDALGPGLDPTKETGWYPQPPVAPEAGAPESMPWWMQTVAIEVESQDIEDPVQESQ